MNIQTLFFVILASFSLLCQSAEIRVFTEHSPPGEYEDDNGRVTGATAEMVRELMHRLKLTSDIEILPWKRAYKMLLAGPNIALFETTRTQDRESFFKWVGPIKRVRWGFYGKKSANLKISSLNDAMQTKKICVYNGDAKGEYLKSLGFTELYQPTHPVQCLKMLEHDRVTLWVSSDSATAPMFKEAGVDPSEFEMLYAFSTKYLYIALSQDIDDEVVSLWQKTLDAMKMDGTLALFYKGTYSTDLIRAISDTHPPNIP